MRRGRKALAFGKAIGGGLLRAYLVAFLAGCATTRQVSVQEARELQTRFYNADYETMFEAAKACLQDLNYTVSMADWESGSLSAYCLSSSKLAAIGAPSEEGDDDGLPTWATVLLVATGVILVVGLIVLLSSDDDDDDDDGKTKEEAGREAFASIRQRAAPDSTRTRGDRQGEEERESAEKRERHEHHDSPGGDIFVALGGDDEVITTTAYRYDITVNLGQATGGTTMRVNAQATKLEDGMPAEAGPIYEKAFYDNFFAVMDGALQLQSR